TLLNIMTYPCNMTKPCPSRTLSRPARLPWRGGRCALLAQAELFNQGAGGVGVAISEVIKQLATAADHAQQASTRVVVFRVRLEVLGKVVDAGGKQGHLHLGRTGIARCALKLGNNV